MKLQDDVAGATFMAAAKVQAYFIQWHSVVQLNYYSRSTD